MSGPSVDVVIPNYNYARYLRVCAESVLSQDMEKLRLLIIDNASTDNSVAVAREIAAADPRVELLLRPVNKGPHASFNDGIDWAGADYFVLLFADDVLTPGALQRAVSLMQHDRTIAFTYGRDIAIAGDAPMPELPLQPKRRPIGLKRAGPSSSGSVGSVSSRFRQPRLSSEHRHRKRRAIIARRCPIATITTCGCVWRCGGGWLRWTVFRWACARMGKIARSNC